MAIQRQKLQSPSPPSQQVPESTAPPFTLEQARQQLEEHAFLLTCLQRYILSQEEDIKQLKGRLGLVERQLEEEEKRRERLKGVLKEGIV